MDTVDGAAGVDSGIRRHGVGDSMCGDVYFDEYGHGAIVAGGECVGRDSRRGQRGLDCVCGDGKAGDGAVRGG